MRNLFFPIILTILVVSCEERYEKSSAYTQPAVTSSADVTTNRILTPTNPGGGDVIGKGEPLDPEESERRKNKNISQPIVWGESLAGITMETTFEDASGVLSNVIGSSGVFLFYSEHIAVAWTGAQPNVPFAIVALDGYGGTLTLPAPFGDVKIGSDVSAHLGSYEANVALMKNLAISFDGQQPGYDCIASNTCRYLEFDDGFKQFEFRKGVMSINAENKISLVYSLIEQSYPTPATGDFIYGTSIAGYSLNSSKLVTEQVLGFPVQSDAFFDFYDSLNLAFQWNPLTGNPLVIFAQKKFPGDIKIGDSINKKIGDSMLDILDAPPNPEVVTIEEIEQTHAPALLVKLDQILHSRANDYNCLDEAVPTCEIEIFDDQIVLNLSQGSFFVAKNNTLDLELASIYAVRTFEAQQP